MNGKSDYWTKEGTCIGVRICGKVYTPEHKYLDGELHCKNSHGLCGFCFDLQKCLKAYPLSYEEMAEI